MKSNRYQYHAMDMIMSETGHFGIGRAALFGEIVSESINAIEMGADLCHICLYL